MPYVDAKVVIDKIWNFNIMLWFKNLKILSDFLWSFAVKESIMAEKNDNNWIYTSRPVLYNSKKFPVFDIFCVTHISDIAGWN